MRRYLPELIYGASDVLSKRSRVEAQMRPSLRKAMGTGVATFVGFLTAGIVPLLAYLLPWFQGMRFPAAVALALVTLFAFGAGRAATDRRWLVAGLEMLAIGALAAGVAYGVGALGARIVDFRGWNSLGPAAAAW